MKRLLHIILPSLIFTFVRDAVCDQDHWQIVTSEQEVILQDNSQPEGGLFVQALQFRTKADIGSNLQVDLRFTSNGTYRISTDKRSGKNTVTFERTSEDDGLTHQLQIQLSNPVQYKIEGCTTDWVDVENNCSPNSDGYTIWTVRKNFTADEGHSMVITCNQQLMTDLVFLNAEKSCSENWARSMHSFNFMEDSTSGTVTDSSYRLPPGCQHFPDSWYDKNLRTDTYFPIPYEKTFRLHCDDAVARYRLLVGNREIGCNPYLQLEGGFEYSTSHTPQCVLADLRDWRDDVERDVLVPVTISMEPIQINTTAKQGSKEVLSIRLYSFSAKISVRFTNPMQYWIKSCTKDWSDFQCEEESDGSRIWTIRRDPDLEFLCNNKSVVNFAKDFEDNSDCQETWNTYKDEDKFWFHAETTVSYSLKADLTTWRKTDQETKAKNMVMNLEKYPLQFRTDSPLGSNKSIAVEFLGGVGLQKFVFIVELNDTAFLHIHLCTSTAHELDLTSCYSVNSKQNEIIWTLERSQNTVIVFCNGIKMMDYEKMAAELKNEEPCINEWDLSAAKRLSFWNNDEATMAYRYMPKNCDSIPQDWTGVAVPQELPVPNGTEIRLSCVSEEEVVYVSRIVTCNTRYPAGYQYQYPGKPQCIKAPGG